MVIPHGHFLFNESSVQLTLSPHDDQMTWGDLGITIQGISKFMLDWEFMGVTFVMHADGPRAEVGRGRFNSLA